MTSFCFQPPPFVNGLRANINPSLLTIGERLKYMPRLQYMATLSQGVGMSSPLVSKHNVTAFIPTDKAFIQVRSKESRRIAFLTNLMGSVRHPHAILTFIVVRPSTYLSTRGGPFWFGSTTINF